MKKRNIFLFLLCTLWNVEISDGGTLVVAPIKLRLPMNSLIGLLALKVSKLSLLTSLFSAGKLKILKSRKRTDVSLPQLPPLPFPPPGFFPPPHPLHFGSFHGPPFLPPPPFIPPPPPKFLRTKLIDPKDACIMRQVCNFEFSPDYLEGGSMEKLLLALIEKPKKSRFRRDDTEFWINIQKVPKEERLGSDICENRYPSCFFSPIFRTRRSLPTPYNRQDVKELVDRIWQLWWRLLPL